MPFCLDSHKDLRISNLLHEMEFLVLRRDFLLDLVILMGWGLIDRELGWELGLGLLVLGDLYFLVELAVNCCTN